MAQEEDGYLYTARTNNASHLFEAASAWYQATGKRDLLWTDVIGRKMYLTGGIGATGSGEALGARYQLPNMSAYNETCAAIGNIFWNDRMFRLHGDAKYIDVLERTL